MRYAIALALVLLGGCSESVVEKTKPLGGSCLACHDGITDVHPFFALACVDCHGGNDAVDVPKGVNVRDRDVMAKSHVRPKNPAFWWKNGIDEEFFNPALTGARLAQNFEWDSEINRDVN